MRIYGKRLWGCTVELPTRRGKGWCVSWVAPSVFLFYSCWTRASKMEAGCELLWDHHSGVLKASSCSGWVCLLGGDFCDRRSCETVYELFEFCNNISWDIAAELLLWGVMICIRSSNGFWRDGGKKNSFCMLWTSEDAFPRVLVCVCICFFANYVWTIFICLSTIFGANVKPRPPSANWFGFRLISVSLASIHLGNAENSFPCAGGWAFPFISFVSALGWRA